MHLLELRHPSILNHASRVSLSTVTETRDFQQRVAKLADQESIDESRTSNSKAYIHWRLNFKRTSKESKMIRRMRSVHKTDSGMNPAVMKVFHTSPLNPAKLNSLQMTREFLSELMSEFSWASPQICIGVFRPRMSGWWFQPHWKIWVRQLGIPKILFQSPPTSHYSHHIPIETTIKSH